MKDITINSKNVIVGYYEDKVPVYYDLDKKYAALCYIACKKRNKSQKKNKKLKQLKLHDKS